MDPQPTGLSVPAFAVFILPNALGAVYRRHRQADQARVTDLIAAPAPYGEVGGADPVAPGGCAPKIVGARKSQTCLARRLATAELQLAAAMMTHTLIVQRRTRIKLTLFRCTSAELFFSCCDSVAASRQRPGHHDQVLAMHNERRREHRPRHHDQVPETHSERRRGQRPGHHVQLPARLCGLKKTLESCESSGCAPKNVGTRKSPACLARRLATAGLQLAAATITRARITQRSTRENFTRFRCTSGFLFSFCDSVAALRQRPGHHGQVPATHNERRRGQRPGHHDQAPTTHNERRRGQRPGATIKYLHFTTSAAAGNGRAQRSSTCNANRVAPRASAWAPRPRPSTCDAQGAPLETTGPRPTYTKQLGENSDESPVVWRLLK
jgi:hypothetical protein